MDVPGFPPKCYKTAGGQRERGGREVREGGRRVPLPPKSYKTHKCTGG